MNASDPLIHLEGVTKVFVTDEVETHALAGIHIDIQARRICVHFRAFRLREIDPVGHPGPARFAEFGHLYPERKAGAESEAFRARAHSQPRNRVHFSGVQPDRRSERLRKCRAAAHLSRHGSARSQEKGARGARARRHVAPHQALSVTALRRSAAARCRGARPGGRSLHPARRRAHRKPRFAERRSRSWTCCANCIAAAPPSAW